MPDGATLGPQRSGEQWSALIRAEDSAMFGPEMVIDEATVDDIIIHLAAEYERAAA